MSQSLKRSIAQSTVWVMLAAFLVSGAIFNEGIYCFGADGHVRIEPLGAECYQASRSSQSSPASSVSLNGDGGEDACGSCTDVPLITLLFLPPRRTSLPAFVSMGSSAGFNGLSLLLPGAWGKTFFPRVPAIHSFLFSFLPSVILLL